MTLHNLPSAAMSVCRCVCAVSCNALLAFQGSSITVWA